MPKFGTRSQANLATCHPSLQRIFNEVVKHFDCSVLCGHRSQALQDALQDADPPRTQVAWPNSTHNDTPSTGTDVVPWPINWDDRERMTYFAGFVLGVALGMGISVRWGGDWDSDTELDDNKFDDLPHFELVL